ncbi:unnamed protein product [Owenia fusiformis]|uniref:Peptidase S9 prolyl oligopeptidase catalytic domain-containing protein n=1 Tax=Owenia fusiformis TaxID=6347 RepID=A0A8J1USZ8_OWEFU|nr:unnamed protein product [Owenia fusiformis]
MKILGLVLVGLVLRFANSQPVRLERYNVDRNHISVSGISSGAAMAVQLHVAFSHTFRGVGTFAGVPYFCAQGSALDAINVCMDAPQSINVGELITEASDAANNGRIDSTNGLLQDRVYMYHGAVDDVVLPAAVEKVQEFYNNYGGNTRVQLITDGGHGMPTDNYGNSCSSSSSPYINNCGVNGAFECLNHIHGNIQAPSATLNGVFQEYQQTEFAPGTDSFESAGFMYVPSRCVDQTRACKLHIALHGCLQGREEVGDVYARNAGYNEVAESNDIIVLYPQLRADTLLGNPNGCWDWWGYEDNAFFPLEYHVRVGPQMAAVKNMLDRVVGTN